MKTRKITILLAAILLCAATYSQTSLATNVPEEVLSSFRAKFPSASNIMWIKEPNSNYEALFANGSMQQRAEFTPGGQWVETESSIKPAALPKNIRTSFMKNNPGCKISEAEEVQTSDKGKVYDLGCKSMSGMKEYRVNQNGSQKIINKE